MSIGIIHVQIGCDKNLTRSGDATSLLLSGRETVDVILIGHVICVLVAKTSNLHIDGSEVVYACTRSCFEEKEHMRPSQSDFNRHALSLKLRETGRFLGYVAESPLEGRRRKFLAVHKVDSPQC